MKRIFWMMIIGLSVILDVHANAIISGKITCSGVGVEGVLVSDGFAVTTTDASGKYSFESDKKSEVVFYSIPSGYMPYESYSLTNDQMIFPTYWQAMTYPRQPNKNETSHNFKLKAMPGDNYIMVMAADIQLGNRSDNKDVTSASNTYFSRMYQEKQVAGNTPIYSMMMGDMCYDMYWYTQNFNHKSYRALFSNNYGLHKMYQFPMMGNHDNDAATAYTDSTDYEASKEFRETMGPPYYSFNIGKIHYIVLDDIEYINSGDPIADGCAGSSNYNTGITDYQIEWMKKDLALVSKDKTIFLCLHAPIWGLTADWQAYPHLSFPQDGYAVCDLLKDYKQVHIFSGHLHNLYNIEPTNYGYTNIYEHNLPCVGGNLWWAAYYTNLMCKDGTTKYDYNTNCSDGCPGSYDVVYVNGDSISWQLHTLTQNDDGQFRIIDGNTVRDFYKTDTVIPLIIAKYGRPNLAELDDNTIMVNVFNYDQKWKVEIFEDGTPLEVAHTPMEDPIHTLMYDIPRWNHFVNKAGDGVGRYTSSLGTFVNKHMFVAHAKSATTPVKVRVTDRFGVVYQKTMNRPIPYTIDDLMEGGEETILTSVQEKILEANTTRVYTNASGINIDAKEKGTASITSMNGATKVVTVNEGHNEYSMQQGGIYIVTYKGKSKKVFVR